MFAPPRRSLLSLLVAVPLLLMGVPATSFAQNEREDSGRITRGLRVLYDFSSTKGNRVEDRSGVGEPLHLEIENPSDVNRRPGWLEVKGKTSIRSNGPAKKVIDAVRTSGEITVETWLRPAGTNATGPARIVTISKNPNERNLTLGQEKDRFEVRLRSTRTSTNGIPALEGPPKGVATKPMHVVYTRNNDGSARLYLNGEQRAERTVAGDLKNWDTSLRLALANELSGDRPWTGTFYLVAIYDRSLVPGEVARNFAAGPGLDLPDAPVVAKPVEPRSPGESAKLFDEQVAGILANHCLECHDSRSRQGRLDLSRELAAMTGGDNGRVIHRNDAAKSAVWTVVESDEMPLDRPPLTPAEKSLLKRWIETGAVWTVDVIDAEAYATERHADGNWLRRLTVPEYIETVRVAVGVDIAEEARKTLPRDLRADGFTNTAYNLNVDLAHVRAYAELAETIVAEMDVPGFILRHTTCRASNEECFGEAVRRIGKRLLRGPLTDREVADFVGIAMAVEKEGGKFDESMSLVLEAMLQSPRFVYRVENQVGNGDPRPVEPFELASRLSYIVWGAPPDDELMLAAENGHLRTEKDVEVQVRRMLKDPRAIERSKAFLTEWLNLDRLATLQPHEERFPAWNEDLAADMRAETLAFFEEVVWKRERPLTELLNAQVTFATPRLAKHYGLQSTGDGQREYDLSKVSSRGGLLTQGSVLTIGGDEASMVARGLFVLKDLLRGRVQDPPPCVDTTPVATKEGLTQRSIAEDRIANAQCGGCHVKFEPLAFGLEKYDGIGAFHEKDEHGNPLRDDGQLLFPGSDETVPYDNAAELFDLLAESQRVRQCITWKVAQYALGRPLGKRDGEILEHVDAEATTNGGTYAALVTALCKSDLVRMTRTETIGDEE